MRQGASFGLRQEIFSFSSSQKQSLQLSGMQELIKILSSSGFISPFFSTCLSNESTFTLNPGFD
jgi:hypothetical protein